MNVLEALKALASYPIPRTYINNVLADLELDPNALASNEVRKSNAYKRATAAVFRFLITAPNISQNGISYSLSSEDKAYYKAQAAAIEKELHEINNIYGYQGDEI